jgi:hypothetical protein
VNQAQNVFPAISTLIPASRRKILAISCPEMDWGKDPMANTPSPGLNLFYETQ